MRSLTCGSVAGMLLVGATASAQSPPPAGGLLPDTLDDAELPPPSERLHMRLDYAGPPGCHQGGLFEDALRIRLRFYWEPWLSSSRWRLVARVTPNGPGFGGSGELFDPAGKRRWKTAYQGPWSCYAVIRMLAIDLSIFMLRWDHPPPAPACQPAEPAEPPAPFPPDGQAPACVMPQEWTTRPPERAPFAIRIGAFGGVERLSSEVGSVGFALDVGVRYRWGSVALELHGDPPLAPTIKPSGEQSFSRIAGALLLCWHRDWAFVCAKGEGGAFLFPTRVPGSPPALASGAAGARLGGEVSVGRPWFFLRAAVDVGVPFGHRTIFSGENGAVFDVAGINAAFWLGALVELERRTR